MPETLQVPQTRTAPQDHPIFKRGPQIFAPVSKKSMKTSPKNTTGENQNSALELQKLSQDPALAAKASSLEKNNQPR